MCRGGRRSALPPHARRNAGAVSAVHDARDDQRDFQDLPEVSTELPPSSSPYANLEAVVLASAPVVAA
jgi:hypothetical protein